MTQETLILVDEANTTLGYAPRGQCHAGDGLLHRAVAVVLLDPARRVLLQHRRSSLWDGFWDLTAATHTLVIEGREESCLEAGRRCLDTEWSIRTPLQELFAFRYFERQGASSEREYCVVLTGTYEGRLVLNPQAAYGFRWSPFEECLRDIADRPATYTPWAQIALAQLAGHF